MSDPRVLGQAGLRLCHTQANWVRRPKFLGSGSRCQTQVVSSSSSSRNSNNNSSSNNNNNWFYPSNQIYVFFYNNNIYFKFKNMNEFKNINNTIKLVWSQVSIIFNLFK